MKDFTMSVYASEKELYKAKAEYYEDLFYKAENLLRIARDSLGNRGDPATEGKIDRFLESLDE